MDTSVERYPALCFGQIGLYIIQVCPSYGLITEHTVEVGLSIVELEVSNMFWFRFPGLSVSILSPSVPKWPKRSEAMDYVY